MLSTQKCFFFLEKPNSDITHPDYVPSIVAISKTEKHLKNIERHNSRKRRELMPTKASKKRKLFSPDCAEETKAIPTTADNQNDIDFNAEVVLDEHTPLDVTGPASKTNDLNGVIDDTDGISNPQLSLTILQEHEVQTEMNFLRREKEALTKKVYSLEEQLIFSRYDTSLLLKNNQASQYLTGLNSDVFFKVISFLKPCLKVPRMNIPLENQILMTLVRLRLNIPQEYLSLQLGLSKSTINATVQKVINLMYYKLKFLIHWPDRDYIRQTIPAVFKQYFPKLTCIIDCFEIFIERPGKLNARAYVYSNYKKHSTVKYLIGCNPLGAVSFLSSGWGGRATDCQIVRNSGFLSSSLHYPGDQILADRGFTLQDDFAASCSAELLIPAFTKGKSQLTPREVEITRQIAHVRIHIERVIGVIKSRYSILDGPIPITMVKSWTDESNNNVPNIDRLVHVCAALANLGTGIVYKDLHKDH